MTAFIESSRLIIVILSCDNILLATSPTDEQFELSCSFSSLSNNASVIRNDISLVNNFSLDIALFLPMDVQFSGNAKRKFRGAVVPS
jgi:hypothetical protein